MKKYRILKWILISLGSLILLLFGFGLWLRSLLPSIDSTIENSRVEDLVYVSENVPPLRGKILAVVTSMDTMGSSGKSTGYELTELARAYYVFKANGFDVDIASPKGGKPPVVIDDEDMGAFDYAFLNDATAQYKAMNTLSMDEVVPEEYKGVYFVGGKGAMFDFPDNKVIQTMVRDYYQSGKVIGAVCHGPAALVNVTLDNGRPLVENKTVSGFTNKEELLLIPDATSIFPFLLQDKLEDKGAKFNEGMMYLEKVSHDSNLITGQNPWSVWALAETMVKQLGYTPKLRVITSEENAVQVLYTYQTEGSQKAKQQIKNLIQTKKQPVDRLILAQHSIVSVMNADVKKFFDILGLVSYTKKLIPEE